MKESSKSKPKSSGREVKLRSLVLINDDYNSFDYVIDCLTAICDHNSIQAEQCALITHYKGSCVIMLGDNIDLLHIKDDLTLYGLNIEIR